LRGPERPGGVRARAGRDRGARLLRGAERPRGGRLDRLRSLRDDPFAQERADGPPDARATQRAGGEPMSTRTNGSRGTPVIRIEGLKKEYVLGAEVVYALRGVD